MTDKHKCTTVLYHSDADGFGAAFAIWMVLGNDVTYIPVQYSQPVPEIPESTEILYIVDFSYKRDICEDLSSKYDLHIFDHHKTAAVELDGLHCATFDQSRSGCAIVWEAMHSAPMPLLLKYVQDRDLWKFNMPNSEEVNLYIATLPHEFEQWADELDHRFIGRAIAAGTAIKTFRDGQIKGALRNVRIMRMCSEVGTWEIPVSNCSANVSEVGNSLCTEYPEAAFSATYCDRKDVRSWSLRSVGDFDVSPIARMFGGGGHKNAAGFSTDIGWPQITPDEFITSFMEAPE